MSYQNRKMNENYRRNGKLQSCEPCRKGKLRCDHMTPTCGRCARRNKPEQCVYHPAPLTKKAPVTRTPESLTSTPPAPAPAEIIGGNLPSLPRLAFPQASPVGLPRAARASSLPAQPICQPANESRLPTSDCQFRSDVFERTSSFVSYSAILNENESQIGILPNNPTVPTSSISQSHIERGATVLLFLKNLPLYGKYIDKWFTFTHGMVIVEPMCKIWTAGIWSVWHKTLQSTRASDLRFMSEKVWSNTTKPLSQLLNRHTTPTEFSASVTGENLRWEIVGIVMTLVCLVSQTLHDGDAIFCPPNEPPLDRRALATETANAAEACVKMCTDFDIMNDLFLWLLYEFTVAFNSMRTKGSYMNWQRSGYLNLAIMSFGLHEEIKVDDDTPFFITELRKRLFITCYDNDKYTASFVGRPPRLTRQYCRIQLPLDLTDAQLMSDGLDLDAAIASLDEDGWNQRGLIQRSTFSRLFATNALMVEEILEISLGVSLSSDEIVHRAADIERRALQLRENCPSFLRIDPNNIWDKKHTPVETVFLAYIHLADLGYHFLLQRTLVKKVGADSTKLLNVSREIFTFVLALANGREGLRDFQMDWEQVLTMYGIPSAAVIAVELLHQEKDPCSISATTRPLPRSDTIQDLSVFVACLGNVWSVNGHSICERGRKFLKKVLDTILEPASATIHSSSSVEGLGETTFTTPLFQTGNDADFLKWLEGMDWEQDSWGNIN
ncbi:hypothetical protein P154DRAFT_367137 [Amniculicola lignicola CBS 123094]|uniref:Zn(2)-C6 fungal-type domain-containing protein n=1 Tax=Amniculicola lignicola CBS 123094 TaxID=1392246 RepID=A0A6A5VYK3_9PLEO|nr:hypothetical protein P154DRAFT_367137 [Amniculicola lignicola CBS 123094]